MAKIYGEDLLSLPRDLYIPPEALQLYLENFEGPLDLLLYLIRKAKFNILDIPMAVLTRQYMEFVEVMREKNLNLAAEYLVMAAILIDIKCRMLLPQNASSRVDEGDEEDPRAALVRRLLHYEQIQKGALRLGEHPLVNRDFVWASAECLVVVQTIPPTVTSHELVNIWQGLLTRLKIRARFEIHSEALSLREQMSRVIKMLHEQEGKFVRFIDLFASSSALHWVMGFIAILELAKQGMVDLEQGEWQSDSADEAPSLFVRASGLTSHVPH